MKHIALITLGFVLLCTTASHAQQVEKTEETILPQAKTALSTEEVPVLEEENTVNTDTTTAEETKADKKKKKKKKATTLPRNSSTSYLLHVGGDEFVREDIAIHYSDYPFYEWTLSAGVSTMGLTMEVLTPISKSLKLRGGIDLFFYDSKYYDIGVDDPDGNLAKAFGYKPNLSIKGKNHMIHAHALVDYYPVPDGLFFFSGGLYFGQNKTDLSGYFIDHKGDRAKLLNPNTEWPDLDFQGNLLKMAEGDLKADVTLGNIIKPYLGIGIGRVVTSKRLGFSFELGMMYQGDYVLKQDGTKVVFDLSESGEYNEKAEKWLNRITWWPKVSFQVRYRLF
ncbi:MAG: hypothetical protein LBI73_15165 [Myroides sp.]|nr:hypothetical protein [Myroides sp.]